MNRLNGSSCSKVKYMAPSSIHYIHPHIPSSLSENPSGSYPELDRTITELTSSGLTNTHHLKVQIVQKDGHWFALNSAQLELCRRLEKGGVCPKVKVDVVPSEDVPLNVRNLMMLPTSGKELTSKTEKQKNGRTTSLVQGSGGGGIVGTRRKGYQQLVQEEQEQQDDDEDGDEKDLSDDVSGDDVDIVEATEGSSSDAISDSDVDWSDEDFESSEGDWSNAEDKNQCICSDAPEVTSEEDENNCLL